MFKKLSLTPKGVATRARVYEAAIRLFREQGFEETTMRQVAKAAELSPGAAYHYFDSKEAIVLAYYEEIQAEHERLARDELRGIRAAEDRVRIALVLKLRVLKRDQRLMGALLRFAGSPDHPLSFLGTATRTLQERSVRVFGESLETVRLPDELAQVAPQLLWALHMGLLLFFLYDRSPGHRSTQRLADGAAVLFVRGLRLLASPFARSYRRRVIRLLESAGLIPTTVEVT